MPGLTLGPDPLQLALAFLVTGEANKQKVWNELVSSGYLPSKQIKRFIMAP